MAVKPEGLLILCVMAIAWPGCPTTGGKAGGFCNALLASQTALLMLRGFICFLLCRGYSTVQPACKVHVCNAISDTRSSYGRSQWESAVLGYNPGVSSAHLKGHFSLDKTVLPCCTVFPGKKCHAEGGGRAIYCIFFGDSPRGGLLLSHCISAAMRLRIECIGSVNFLPQLYWFHSGILSLKHESSIFRSFIQLCMWFWKCQAS